jgi:hypothetical protein
MNRSQIVESIRRNGWLDGIHYLASPYTNYAKGYDAAAQDVAKVAAALMHDGLIVYAPIAHGRAIDRAGTLPSTHEFWMRQCKAPFLACTTLIVAKLSGWRDSRGVSMEIGWSADLDMPAFYLDCDGIV